MRISLLLVSLLALAVPSQADDCGTGLQTFMTGNVWLLSFRNLDLAAKNKNIADNIGCGDPAKVSLFASTIETLSTTCGSTSLGAFMGLIQDTLCMQDSKGNYCLGSVLSVLDPAEILAEVSKENGDILNYFLSLDKSLLKDSNIAASVCGSEECAYKIIARAAELAREIALANSWQINNEIKLVVQVAATFLDACPTDDDGKACIEKADIYFDNGLLTAESCKNGKLIPCARRLAANTGSFDATPDNPCAEEVFTAGTFSLHFPNLDYALVEGIEAKVAKYLAEDTSMLMNLAASNGLAAVSSANLLSIAPLVEQGSPGTKVTFTVSGPGLTANVMEAVIALENIPGDLDLFFFNTDMNLEAKYFIDSTDPKALTSKSVTSQVISSTTGMPTPALSASPTQAEDAASTANHLQVGVAASLVIAIALL